MFDSVTLREAPASGLGRRPAGEEDLFTLTWSARPPRASASPPGAGWAIVGPGGGALAEALRRRGLSPAAFPGLGALTEAIDSGGPVPDVVVLKGTARDEGADRRRGCTRAARHVLGAVRGWLADQRLTGSKLVILTTGAVAASELEDVPDLPAAAVWGLVRAAQAEHPRGTSRCWTSTATKASLSMVPAGPVDRRAGAGYPLGCRLRSPARPVP